MTARELVQQLRERGAELRLDGDRLLLTAPRSVIGGETRDELRARKSEILELLRQEAAAATEVVLPDGVHPLSSAQQSMWYLEAEQTDLAVFNLYIALSIHGPLDLAALEGTLLELLERHDALRARIVEANGQLGQRIESASSANLQVEDVNDDVTLQRRLTRELAQPFEILENRLYRFRLFRMTPGRHVLLLVFDHMIADGLSMAILKEELAALYKVKIGNDTALPPASRKRYTELAREETRWLGSSAARRQLEYWKGRLGGEFPVLDLPTDKPRPASPSGRGDALRLSLSRQTVDALQGAAREVNASSNMLLTAATAVLLSTLSGQREVVIGMPCANRNREGSERVVGLFMNPVALRIPVDRSAGFGKLVDLVRRRSLEAIENQAMPFDQIVKALGSNRDMSRTPVFQAMVTSLPDADRVFRAGDVVFEPLSIRRGTSQMDIVLWCRDGDHGMNIDLEYNSDIFEEATAQSMLDRFERILAEVIRNPRQDVCDLPVLSKEELDTLSRWGSGEERDWSRTTIDAMLDEQCERTPNDIAVSCGEMTVDYRTLKDRASIVAGGLHAMDVRRGDVVGVFVERSERLPEVLLGVLKSGAAYLPLDSEAPAGRLQWMLEDAGVNVVIADDGVDLASLGSFKGRVITPQSLSTMRSAGTSRQAHAPDDVAYVIYTSGSTGKPKGVMVPHRSVTNFLRAMEETLDVSGNDRFLALTTLTFDIAVLELLLPLYVGAQTEIVSRDEAREGDMLRQRLADFRPTVMQATPATWQLLLDSGWQGDESLTVLSGGEALPAPLAQGLLQCSRCVINLYGPTETTVWSTAHRVTLDDDPVPIGRPIANTQVYVLDTLGYPTPPGVPGELYIGGEGVTRGYLNRPQLSAERFVPDRRNVNDGRLYRTGDRVRFLHDGRLEYLGRVDFQIKLRGHRMEPGEIENALEAHEAVSRAVVVVREMESGNGKDSRLVAYVTLAEGVRASIEGLRDHLRQLLPAYMVPQHFVDLETMPLTASGKVDRNALPSPLAVPQGNRVLPRTATEKSIARIWQDVLGVESVSADDNFFDLGGHSLSSMKVIATIDQETGVRLRPRLLVLNTLREIAAACDEAMPHEERHRPVQAGKWKSVVNALFGRA